MQAIINGEMYEVEPAVKVIIDKLMIENAELKKENARLEEGYRKSIGVIAATDCAECKDKPVKRGHFERFSDDEQFKALREYGIPFNGICSICSSMMFDTDKFCGECGAKMDGGADNE